jgi:hypothetical protein
MKGNVESLRACGKHGSGEKSVEVFGVKAKRKEITWKRDT